MFTANLVYAIARASKSVSDSEIASNTKISMLIEKVHFTIKTLNF